MHEIRPHKSNEIKFREMTKMQGGDYKSSLHYLALQPGHSGLSFEQFLLYFKNKDIGKLDIATSETILRDAFHKRLSSFYNKNEISCLDEFRMIMKNDFSLEKCQAPSLSIGRPFIFIVLSSLTF